MLSNTSIFSLHLFTKKQNRIVNNNLDKERKKEKKKQKILFTIIDVLWEFSTKLFCMHRITIIHFTGKLCPTFNKIKLLFFSVRLLLPGFGIHRLLLLLNFQYFNELINFQLTHTPNEFDFRIIFSRSHSFSLSVSLSDSLALYVSLSSSCTPGHGTSYAWIVLFGEIVQLCISKSPDAIVNNRVFLVIA